MVVSVFKHNIECWVIDTLTVDCVPILYLYLSNSMKLNIVYLKKEVHENYLKLVKGMTKASNDCMFVFIILV